MADNSTQKQKDEKETKRRKQVKKMTKILSKAWALPNAEPFQMSQKSSAPGHAFDLAFIGQNLDEGEYKLGRNGWEQFAKDIGGVYNRHIERKSKHHKIAQDHRAEVQQMLSKIDESLGRFSTKHVPGSTSSSSERDPTKRKREEVAGPKKKFAKTELTISDRQAKAVGDLCRYIESVGGTRHQVASFEARTSKRSDGRYESTFYNAGRRFKSMVDVGRFLGLVKEKAQSRNTTQKKKPTSSKEADVEKRKLRKELDKLMKAHQKGTKALEDFQNGQNETKYPVDDDILMVEEKRSGAPKITPTRCPAARTPDLVGFPGVPDQCLPDLLMVWDFLCTFGRAISVNAATLDDFVAAMTYRPPQSEMEGDGLNPTSHQPPVLIAEAHLGLLKFLLQDPSSEDWWWSILETDEAGAGESATELDDRSADPKVPEIKVDFAILLAQEEDPLITSSWLQALEPIRNVKAGKGQHIKQCIRTAREVAANRVVRAYLKKALSNIKSKDGGFTKRAVVWLIDRFREARPDLYGRVSQEAAFKQRAKVVEEVSGLMDKMAGTSDSVVVEAVDYSDAESDDDDDDDSDESDDEDMDPGLREDQQPDNHSETKCKSAIPPKPLPTLVDLLLPPGKPLPNSDLTSSFTWPQLAAASACRIMHRYKRLRNEVDDKLRDSKGLQVMTIGERRARERESTQRVLSECSTIRHDWDPSERAVDHLSRGGNYLSLGIVERLCILKLLVEAAYDARRTYEVVDGNFKARINAVKALEAEERRAKKEAKEEAAAAEKSARESLVEKAREKYFQEKRDELKRLNDQTNEFSNDIVDGLTEQDIVDFDEDTRAEYEALPTSQSFSKTEVAKMVRQMQEEAAFDTHSVVVITMDEIAHRDEEELQAMEDDLAAYEDVDISELGRDGTRRVERLRREIEHVKESSDVMPDIRESAIETLRDAIEDGTIKSLKAAIRTAKNAKLMGEDRSTGGIWALDLLRDAALELKLAERRKRVVEAQKDLVAKRNKCFIRTEPIGRDRFRNNFWHFSADENGRVWVEAEYVTDVTQDLKPAFGFVELASTPSEISLGPEEKEEDFCDLDAKEDFVIFARKEFHPTGQLKGLSRHFWGCHSAESSLKGLMKTLDSRGTHEKELKSNLKETLEESGLSAGSLQDDEERRVGDATKEKDTSGVHQDDSVVLETGDEGVFRSAIEECTQSPSLPSFVSPILLRDLSTALQLKIRVREVLEPHKEPVVAYFDNATITGWKMHTEPSGMSDMESSSDKMISFPLWRAVKDQAGEVVYLTKSELIESICRYKLWRSYDQSYFEGDAAFLSYRNSLGRHCGRAAEAGLSATPCFFGRLMVKKEQELYTPLKVQTYDNNWGGKSGARNAWISSMKDYCSDFMTARNGLLTLENAFFELTGGFPDSFQLQPKSAENMLQDEKYRVDIELESIEKNMKTLWNSRASRSIFLHIVERSRTTGFLALALDLLCRNCRTYIDANKPQGRGRGTGRVASKASLSYAEEYAPLPMRTTRRRNAWQQAQANTEDWF